MSKSPSHPFDPNSRTLFSQLLDSSIVLDEDFQNLRVETMEQIRCCLTTKGLLPILLKNQLITEYQASRIESGKTYGLILGQYRVLDRIGGGAMGVVFKAEHIDMRRQVAIKVLPLYDEQDPRIHRRFLTEIRVVGQLQHPNIVAAMDSGITTAPNEVPLRYFVMELVQGEDLEECVNSQGPLATAKACDVIHQIAAALGEAQKHNLVHRDIKPSNIRLTLDGQAKLLDFGLTRRFSHRLTEPGMILGTLDFMAPEQTRDAATVDIRADIYGLGGTLFWCLTGKTPFAPEESVIAQIAKRQTQRPPSVRAHRPEIPQELDEVVKRMMGLEPADRFDSPGLVMRALLPFLNPEMRESIRAPAQPTYPASKEIGTQHVLIVDDQAEVAQFCSLALEDGGLRCHKALDGPSALAMAAANRYDLVLLDVHLPGMNGPQICQQLREKLPPSNLKIIMMSGQASPDEMARMLQQGSDDYLSKPISMVQLNGKVKAALRLKEAQDRADFLNIRLLEVNGSLEKTLGAHAGDHIQIRNGLVQALAKLVERREGEPGDHLARMEHYTRCLAEEAATSVAFSGQIDLAFIDLLACCAPLHDLGKVGLPDHILLSPGKLDSNERMLMHTHTIIGSETLRSVIEQHGESMAFLNMAADIARHHHERFDGSGYPDKLAGVNIPLSARHVAIADVYDALRSRRPYKPALSHNVAVELMTKLCDRQFDPDLLQIFVHCSDQFERIFRKLAN